MQFHLDGFRPGDPAVAQLDGALPPTVPMRSLPAAVDVLIVGCGPTGLTLAAQLSAFPEISVAIVEAKPGPLQLGQADGIACRTMEMFQAFGFAHRVAHEAYWVNETVFWRPDPENPAHIVRTGRIQDVEDGLSEFPHVILNQARVHDFYLELMRNSAAGLVPDYNRRLVDLTIPDDVSAGVTARLERVDDGHEGEVETVTARYVVGCDGARSQVRRSIGRELKGDAANHAWGVMDVLATTDFPDIRYKAVVQSADEGTLMVIPREGGYLVRLYIEMDKLAPNERVAGANITVERLVAAANRILRPYTIEVEEVAWWSVYEIGQRLTDRFDDGPQPRVFIAGDACHTHSPKAGQGMNVSMRDAFNLGWKLAAVLRGRGRPELLATYSAERQAVARELIDFDRKFAAMISARPQATAANPGPADGEFQQHFQRSGRFTAGTATRYRPSIITNDATHQQLAAGFEIGTRFHSAPVIRLADAKPMHLGHVVEADGRWRLFAFADDRPITDEQSGLAALCRFLAEDPASPIIVHTPPGDDIDSVIDLRAVLQVGHRTIDLVDMPAVLRPAKGRFGLVDYQKVFCPDREDGPDIFDQRGIDRSVGALVVVRPDQHVADVCPLDATDRLSAFFAAFLTRA